MPAESTFPRMTWSMRSGARATSASAARMAVAANCGAGTVDSEPRSLPMGVRRAATMYDEGIGHLDTILRHTIAADRAGRAERFESHWRYVLRHHQGHFAGPRLRLYRT